MARNIDAIDPPFRGTAVRAQAITPQTTAATAAQPPVLCRRGLRQALGPTDLAQDDRRPTRPQRAAPGPARSHRHHPVHLPLHPWMPHVPRRASRWWAPRCPPRRRPAVSSPPTGPESAQVPRHTVPEAKPKATRRARKVALPPVDDPLVLVPVAGGGGGGREGGGEPSACAPAAATAESQGHPKACQTSTRGASKTSSWGRRGGNSAARINSHAGAVGASRLGGLVNRGPNSCRGRA